MKARRITGVLPEWVASFLALGASLVLAYTASHSAPILRDAESQAIDTQRRHEEGAALYDNLPWNAGPLRILAARLLHRAAGQGAAWNTQRGELFLAWILTPALAAAGVFWWSRSVGAALAGFAVLALGGRHLLADPAPGLPLAPLAAALLPALAAWIRESSAAAICFAAAGALAGVCWGLGLPLALAFSIPVISGLILFSPCRANSTWIPWIAPASAVLPLLFANPAYLAPALLHQLAASRFTRSRRQPLALGLPALACLLLAGGLAAALIFLPALATGTSPGALIRGYLQPAFRHQDAWMFAGMLAAAFPSFLFLLPVWRAGMRVTEPARATRLHLLKLTVSTLILLAALFAPVPVTAAFAACWTWLTLANGSLWRRRSADRFARVLFTGWSIGFACAGSGWEALILPVCCAAIDWEHAARCLAEERTITWPGKAMPALAAALTLALCVQAAGSHQRWRQLTPMPFPGADRVRTTPEQAANLAWLWGHLHARCNAVAGPPWLAGLLAATDMDAANWKPPDHQARVCVVLDGIVEEPWQRSLPEVARHAGLTLRAR